jgi:signal transduction histidine kinase
VSRAASIVGAMKEFSHPGCVEKQAVDLNHAIESTLTISRNEWKYVADMVTELDPDLPPVFCQPTEINQAILNLIVNAAHAIADAIQEDKNHKGVITVSTRRNGNWAEIRVEDTGKGIPKSIRDRVFDPFFTTKEVGHGSGQGLAIARSIIVERHGGTIRFESEWNRGTTFIIRLPIHECEPTAPPAEHKKPSVLLNMPATESGNVSVPAVPLASGIGRVEGESV